MVLGRLWAVEGKNRCHDANARNRRSHALLSVCSGGDCVSDGVAPIEAHALHLSYRTVYRLLIGAITTTSVFAFGNLGKNGRRPSVAG